MSPTALQSEKRALSERLFLLESLNPDTGAATLGDIVRRVLGALTEAKARGEVAFETEALSLDRLEEVITFGKPAGAEAVVPVVDYHEEHMKGLFTDPAFVQNEYYKAPILHQLCVRFQLKPDKVGTPEQFAAAKKWLDHANIGRLATLPEIRKVEDTELHTTKLEQGNISRTIVMDAERTFATKEMKDTHIRDLRFLVVCMGGEYDQSMGLVCAFLKLLFHEKTAIQIVLYIARSILGFGFWTVEQPLYMAADGFALHELFLPAETTQKLQAVHALPNMYLQKWWKALLTDSLSFPAVVDFFGHLIRGRRKFLFQMAVALHMHLAPAVNTASNTPEVLDILYLKHEVPSNKSKFTIPLVTDEVWQRALKVDVRDAMRRLPAARLRLYYSKMHDSFMRTKNPPPQDDDDFDDFEEEEEDDK